jgi:hypothetical protein
MADDEETVESLNAKMAALRAKLAVLTRERPGEVLSLKDAAYRNGLSIERCRQLGKGQPPARPKSMAGGWFDASVWMTASAGGAAPERA